jgi:hypothetical protein
MTAVSVTNDMTGGIIDRFRSMDVAGAAVLAGHVAASVVRNLASTVLVFGVAFLPLAIGAAVLRYRLYDLDRIISRTLAYGLLTLVLGGGYAAVVLVLGQLLGRAW